ncbi:MAG: enoyl-CoA hydratase-related protein [Sporichthyaceae bacterium]
MGNVLRDRSGPVAVITLNRPARRNAVDAALTAELRAAVAVAEQDPTVKAIVLTGSGSVFTAGMDLDAYNAGEGPAILLGDYGFAGFVRHPRRKPCIAAVNGPAIAGGFEVMLACELAVAETHAFFSFPEASIGLIAAAGGLVRLPRRIPPAIAWGVLLAGERIGAERAAHWGLVNSVVPTGASLAAALDLAHRIAAASPQSIRASLRVGRLAVGAEDPVWEYNNATWAEMENSPDTLEGPRAAVERRPPMWQS